MISSKLLQPSDEQNGVSDHQTKQTVFNVKFRRTYYESSYRDSRISNKGLIASSDLVEIKYFSPTVMK